MSIEKVRAIVLSVIPFRETSVIAALLTRTQGRVSGIAKGVRRSPKAPLSIERGLLLELLLYVKPHRDLHTIAEAGVVEYFPSIRAEIGKLALRDGALELVLKSAAASETHPELFDFALSFLENLERSPADPLPVGELWAFFYGWARLLGFHLDLERCQRCGGALPPEQGGLLSIDKGGLVCTTCARATGPAPSFLPPETIAFLIAKERGDETFASGLPLLEQMRIARLLADYCRYHLDFRGELKSLGFLESLARGAG
jgi:DNA repair protein RecO (recombination protein O)